MRKWVTADVAESLVKRMRKQDGKAGNAGSVEWYVDAAIRERLERDRKTVRCPNCGGAAVVQVGSADDAVCKSCGWLVSEGLGVMQRTGMNGRIECEQHKEQNKTKTER